MKSSDETSPLHGGCSNLSFLKTRSKIFSKNNDDFPNKFLGVEVGRDGVGGAREISAKDSYGKTAAADVPFPNTVATDLKPLRQMTTAPPKPELEVPLVDDSLFDGDSIDRFFTCDDDVDAEDEVVAASDLWEVVERRSLQQQKGKGGREEKSITRPSQMAMTLLDCLDIDPIELNSNDFFENNANTMALVMDNKEEAFVKSVPTVPTGTNNKLPTAPENPRAVPAVVAQSKPASTRNRQQVGPTPGAVVPLISVPNLTGIVEPALFPVLPPPTVPLCPSSDPSHKQLVASFSKVMCRSQQSQRSLQKWDKNMGLKRSHSSTMTKTMRSRKKLRQLVSAAMSQVKKEEDAHSGGPGVKRPRGEATGGPRKNCRKKPRKPSLIPPRSGASA